LTAPPLGESLAVMAWMIRLSGQACPACSPRKNAWTSGLLIGLLTFPTVLLGAEQNMGPAQGYYTNAQAEAGKQVFDQVCAVCHGQNLAGGAGPALAGQQFLSVSQFQQVTAYYLFHFMSKHMPANAPGSLSETQYLDLMACVLKANGYRAGSRALTASKDELEAIKIEPQK
jgi:mono/diheme cytochrome c family protein